MKKSRLLGAVCAGVVTIASLPVNAVSITGIFGYVDAYASAGSDLQQEFFGNPAITDTLWSETASAFAFESVLDFCDPFGCYSSDSLANSEASQSSYVASNGLYFSASGESIADVFSSDFSIPADAIAESYFEVAFMLESAYNYNLTGSASGLFESDTGLVDFAGLLFDGGLFDVSGVLAPGNYILYGVATSEANLGNGFANSSFSFELSLTPVPVPVPAAVWLFGSGLLGLVGMARRKKA